MIEQPGSADLLSFWWACLEAGYELEHDDKLMPDDQPVLHYCANGTSAMVFARDMRAAVALIDDHRDASKPMQVKRRRSTQTNEPAARADTLAVKPTAAIDSMQLDDLYPIEDLVSAFPTLLTVAVLRWQLRHRNSNGLAPACVRIGKKLLISRVRYEVWLASRAEVPGGSGPSRNSSIKAGRHE